MKPTLGLIGLVRNNGKLSSGSPMLHEDEMEATTKTSEAIWQLFVYELAQNWNTCTHMYKRL
jgi:hypothetical protein